MALCTGAARWRCIPRFHVIFWNQEMVEPGSGSCCTIDGYHPSYLWQGTRNIHGLFSWHPVFMATAFCLCMTEGVLLLSPDTSPFCPLSRTSKTRLHWLAQLFVFVYASVGLTFIIWSKNRSEQPHFTSWHSILGIITIAATSCQAFWGFALLCPRLVRVTAVSRLKLYHATCGLIVYLLSTGTVLFGLCSDWFQAQVKGPVWYVCLCVPLYPALIIMNQVIDIYLPKRKGQM
ncbi:probable transmembrane reductase CYB561D1 isoform X2 [Pelobates fuscus]|uniref:probable transmembrane reductase CYB561D1 isoform X2 n=1 Tax=Pelobates fuscus TaxID=191477 RepID=UPI002FE49B78